MHIQPQTLSALEKLLLALGLGLSVALLAPYFKFIFLKDEPSSNAYNEETVLREAPVRGSISNSSDRTKKTAPSQLEDIEKLLIK